MILNPVTQRNLEAYQRKLLELVADVKTAAGANRIVVAAARAAGIAEDLPADLYDLAPWQIVDFSSKISAHNSAALEPMSGE